MMRALWSAASGMQAQQLNVDNIANNLANVNTAGFKKDRVDFQDVIYQTLKSPGASATEGLQIPTGLHVGLGVRPVATQKIFTQGNMQQTGNPLDLVIEGEGFFQISMPDGTTAYTRDGGFKRDSQGNLVTSDGYTLQPAITIPAEAADINVGDDGTVTYTISGQSGVQQAGKIDIVRFANPAGLNPVGKNLFTQSDASGDPITDGVGTIAQGWLEMSNVQVVDEMVNMITAQRAYEINSKAIQASDQMLEQAANLRR